MKKEGFSLENKVCKILQGIGYSAEKNSIDKENSEMDIDIFGIPFVDYFNSVLVIQCKGASPEMVLSLYGDTDAFIRKDESVYERGGRYSKTKFFKGCGSGVYEIAIEYDTDAYRTVYILNVADTVYVIHCFQKKSKEGIKTPKEEINIIKQRIKFVKSEIEKGIKSWLLKIMNK